MPFRTVTDPQHHAMLNAELEDFCRTAHILAGTPEFEEAGRFIMSLYCHGATTAEALAAALENRLQREVPVVLPNGDTTDNGRLS